MDNKIRFPTDAGKCTKKISLAMGRHSKDRGTMETFAACTKDDGRLDDIGRG